MVACEGDGVSLDEIVMGLFRSLGKRNLYDLSIYDHVQEVMGCCCQVDSFRMATSKILCSELAWEEAYESHRVSSDAGDSVLENFVVVTVHVYEKRMAFVRSVGEGVVLDEVVIDLFEQDWGCPYGNRVRENLVLGWRGLDVGGEDAEVEAVDDTILYCDA